MAYFYLVSELVFIAVGKSYELIKENPLAISVSVVFVVFYYYIRRPYIMLNEDSKKSPRKRDFIPIKPTPPVYPNGWFVLLESSELKPGQTRNVKALGETFAVFREQTGKAHVLDAYCPHLGANLAAGGTVVGNCIECPFHGWKFRGTDGVCTGVPYADKVPSFAKVKVWTCLEILRLIFVWYHAEGEPPSWYPQDVPEVTKGIWNFRGQTRHYLNCHIQEIAENAADVGHFDQLHGPGFPASGDYHQASTSWIGRLVTHSWEGTWTSHPAPSSHIAGGTVQVGTLIMGKQLPALSYCANIKSQGPGCVQVEVSNSLGRGIMFQFSTPLAPYKHRVFHFLYTESRFPYIISKAFIWGFISMFERDAYIWKNKAYLKNPTLVKEDKLITAFRTWYKQFYSDNSPTWEKIRERSLDW